MVELSAILTQFSEFAKKCYYKKPCAVYWDFGSFKVDPGPPTDKFIELIRDTVFAKRLQEVEFNFILPSFVNNQIKSKNVLKHFVAGNQQHVIDAKLIELIKRFVATNGPEIVIFLISGDANLVKTLKRLTIKKEIKIILVHQETNCNDFLSSIVDDVYLFKNGKLTKMTKSFNVFAVRVKLTAKPTTHELILSNDLMIMFEHEGSIENNIYLGDYRRNNLIWIGFPSKESAKSAVQNKNNSIFYNVHLTVHYIQYPSDTVIQHLTRTSTYAMKHEISQSLFHFIISGFKSKISLKPLSSPSPFESSSTYLIVTGFRDKCITKHRGHLSRLTKLPLRQFWCTKDSVWFRVLKPNQGEKYINLIDNVYYDEYKLSASVSKEVPWHKLNHFDNTENVSNQILVHASILRWALTYMVFVTLLLSLFILDL